MSPSCEKDNHRDKTADDKSASSSPSYSASVSDTMFEVGAAWVHASGTLLQLAISIVNRPPDPPSTEAGSRRWTKQRLKSTRSGTSKAPALIAPWISLACQIDEWCPPSWRIRRRTVTILARAGLDQGSA